MIRYVGNKQVIINTMGIRFVEKIDYRAWGAEPVNFQIKVVYKGSELHHTFQTESERNEIYDNLMIATGIVK